MLQFYTCYNLKYKLDRIIITSSETNIYLKWFIQILINSTKNKTWS